MANAETVALMLNGKLIGEQKVDPYEMNEWQVPYAPGRLEAVGKTGGKVVAHAVVETTGAPVALRADAGPRRAGRRRPRRGAGDGGGAGRQGRPVPTANLPVDLRDRGRADHRPGQRRRQQPRAGEGRRARSLYNGLAQVIVQSEEGGAGALVLRAQAPGLKSAEARIAVRPDRGPPSVPRPA